MTKPTRETNSKPDWMRPSRKLTEAERQEVKNALRGYINRRKAEGAAQ